MVKPFKTILVIIAMLISWVILGLIFFVGVFVNINLIGDLEISINIDSQYFENGYVASFGPLDINKYIKTISNLDIKKLGKYEVVYSFDFLLGKKEIVRTVNVVDGVAPVIELIGEKAIVLNQYYNFEDPGFSAIDNLDGDITNNVKIDSNVDTAKLGSYLVKYTVKDQAGNTAKIHREVEVVNNNILSSPVSKFRLDGLFGNVMLEKTDNLYNYMDDAVIIGDSNIRFLYVFGKYLKGNQVWAKNNLNAGDIATTKITIHDTNEQIKVVDAVKKYKPKFVIASFGLTSTSYLSKDVFVQKVEEFFDMIKTECPDTKLVVVSILPVTTSVAVMQPWINKYNYYLLELCDKHNIGFINVTDSLKDENGYGKEEYFYCKDEEDCGFHLSNKGKQFYVDYLKSVDLAKEIK